MFGRIFYREHFGQTYTSSWGMEVFILSINLARPTVLISVHSEGQTLQSSDSREFWVTSLTLGACQGKIQRKKVWSWDLASCHHLVNIRLIFSFSYIKSSFLRDHKFLNQRLSVISEFFTIQIIGFSSHFKLCPALYLLRTFKLQSPSSVN